MDRTIHGDTMRTLLPCLICCLALRGTRAAFAQERMPLQPLPAQPAAPALPDAAPAAPATETPAGPCDCLGFDWSKVPPVRPMPRLGWFIPPPERCGFYSVVDIFR